MTTAKQFNEKVGSFIRTILPEPIRMEYWSGLKMILFDVFFGKGRFKHGQNLEEKIDIIFEDTQPGVPGVKAVGLDEASFKDYLNDMLALSKDQAFKDEMNDPDYMQTVSNIQNKLLKMYYSRVAACMTISIEKHDAEMEALAEDLTSAYIYGFDAPTPKITKFLKKTKSYFASLKLKKDEGKYKTAIEFKDKIEKSVGNSLSIAGWAATFSGVRALFGKIPVLLGPVPLKHVNYIEIARSGKVLKFRATGTVFLARQEGGADAIKIEGLMYKAEFAIMFLLWGLFIYGQSKFREMDDIPGIKDLKGIIKIGEIRKLNDLLISDVRREKPSYEFHQTFPFVNRHFIIPNCYIETIAIEDKLPLKDVLQYSILLRTYDKPKEVSWVEKEGMKLYGISNKSTMSKISEYSLNAVWRWLNASGWLLDEQEWKIGSADKEGVLDTYYDVDPSTIATITYLNLIGAVT